MNDHIDLAQHHTGWAVIDVYWEDELIETHVSPVNDTKAHENSEDCWCGPSSEDGFYWVHASADRREEYEQGKRGVN